MKWILLIVLVLASASVRAQCQETDSAIECSGSLSDFSIQTNKSIWIHDAAVDSDFLFINTTSAVLIEDSVISVSGASGANGLNKDYSYPDTYCGTLRAGNGRDGQTSVLQITAARITINNSSLTTRGGNGGNGGYCLVCCRTEYYDAFCYGGNGGNGGDSVFNLTGELRIYNSTIGILTGTGGRGGNAAIEKICCRRAGQTCRATSGKNGQQGEFSVNITANENACRYNITMPNGTSFISDTLQINQTGKWKIDTICPVLKIEPVVEPKVIEPETKPCKPYVKCGSWSECNGTQTRNCYDVNECRDNITQTISCEIPAEPAIQEMTEPAKPVTAEAEEPAPETEKKQRGWLLLFSPLLFMPLAARKLMKLNWDERRVFRELKVKIKREMCDGGENERTDRNKTGTAEQTADYRDCCEQKRGRKMGNPQDCDY